MTYWESHRLRKLCLRHKIRFYIAKDRNANYSIQFYGRNASDHWNLSDYPAALNTILMLTRTGSLVAMN